MNPIAEVNQLSVNVADVAVFGCGYWGTWYEFSTVCSD